MFLSNIFYLCFWWLAIFILGAATYPISYRLFPALKDRYGFSKILGLSLFTYLSYLFSVDKTIIIFIVIIVFGIVVFQKLRLKLTLPPFCSFYEVLFAASFFLFALIRSFYPEINGAEKFMDFAILNAVFRAESFPPLDPWLSGENLDFYYYFGHLMVSSIAKLTGTPVGVAYNLGLSMFFALAVTTAASLGYNLTNKRKYAMLTAFFVVISGNLKSVLLAFSIAYSGILSNIPYYWESSRVIPNTANEFPCFTFLHGDLHAHLAAIPLQLLLLVLLLNLYREKNVAFFTCVCTGFVLGFLFPTNSWDYPTYLSITAFLVFYAAGVNKKAFSTLLAIVISSLLLFAPFYEAFNHSGVAGISMVSTYTVIQHYVLVFGLCLLPLVFFVLYRSVPTLKHERPVRIACVLVCFTIILFVSSKTGFQLLAPLLFLISLCAYNLQKTRKKDQADDESFIMLLALTGLLISLFCEIFYINDAFTVPFERFNTVFKLYMQTWILFTVAGVYAVYHFEYKLNGVKQKVWLGFVVLLVISGLIFPAATVLFKTNMFSGEANLDGMAYLEKIYPGDYHAIRWMRLNLADDVIVLERFGESYTLSSRISTNTGIPTVLGWAGHEIMWRLDRAKVNQKINDVNTIYTTRNRSDVLSLINKYNITHIYVGTMEQQYYGKAVLKFKNDSSFKPIYKDVHNSTTIYEIMIG
ncbi:MAG: hypothetical protein EF812_02270 [Methanosarcinales archaeon]|nr:MAG: hypothetical protein EF812_02270 [Methanosarcinales archaeon]